MYYPIAIESPANDNECFGVIVPDLPGCFSAGNSLDDAIKSVHEAISLHLDGLAKDGDDIPLAKNVADHAKNPDYQGMTWAVVDIDLSAYMGKSEKINVTLPSRLIARIDEKVSAHKSLYKSRSNYLAQLASRDLMA
ncbi:type II toxin-antitoxin system HicB family antitoxin [Moraxella nasovis]|uniref:type II toxin-antitoxin system HicB family antitoxin n=1 Tax=Moraxella nasovis TaxID=2904121 RepID=UPI001F61607C|nr:type II toxin-antitoxin system HicB family antitoxin [Moraxella nasovis]UNU73271.1 type II toxin-antitoxin system HicB family antitoxin [Moraxella nasovis]UNU74120.1 type II toxin-antitoxin system HicB family antitoxin [Moraxella nasovis]